jgi:hypothetical protein
MRDVVEVKDGRLDVVLLVSAWYARYLPKAL